jgi:alcohol dehydrogenase class IV
MGRPGVPARQTVSDFITALEMPQSLTEVGVYEDPFPKIAAAALLDHYVHASPRLLHNVSDVLEILRQAA